MPLPAFSKYIPRVKEKYSLTVDPLMKGLGLEGIQKLCFVFMQNLKESVLLFLDF